MGAIKTTFKILSLIGLVIAILISVFGFMAFRDAQDFKESFPVEPNLFLFVDNGNILAGAKNVMHETNPQAVTEEEIAAYQDFLDNEDYEGLLGRNYRIFIFYPGAFDNVLGEIEDTGFVKEQVMDSLRSDNIKEWSIDRAMERIEVPEGMEDMARQQVIEQTPPEQDIRTMMFMLLLGAASQEEGPTYIIKEYRAGNIDIYPRTMLFKFLDHIPESIISSVESRAVSSQ